MGKISDLFNRIRITKEKEIIGESISERIEFKDKGKLGSLSAIENENMRLKNKNEKLWTKMKNSGLLIDTDISSKEARKKIRENERKIIKLQSDIQKKIIKEEQRKIKKIDRKRRRNKIKEGEYNIKTAESDRKIVEAMKKMENIRNGKMSKFYEFNIKDVTDYYRNFEKDMIHTGYEEKCVATTRLASMINMGDKVADAKIIKVLVNGVETKGVFTNFTDNNGMDSRSHNGRVSMMSKELDLTAGSFQRDLNRLQVFDILSGNMDRFGENFAYQISENPINGKYSVIGVYGIDNVRTIRNRFDNNITHYNLEKLTMIDEDILNSLKEITSTSIDNQFSRLIGYYDKKAIIERRDLILDKVKKGSIRVVKANEWGDSTLEDTQKSPHYKEIRREIAYMESHEIAENSRIVNSYDMAVKRVEEYNKKHPKSKQAFPEKPENYDLYKEQKQWREANSKMVEYEGKLATAKAGDTKLPEPPPMGYDKYKAEKEVYTYLSQKQVYDSEIAKTGKSSMKEPKEPENFAKRRKALQVQPKMEAYKEDFKNNFEKQMEDYEKQVREATSTNKPLPKMPEGYLEYKKFKEMENGRVEVSLDELSNTSKNVSHMKTNANQPKHKMGMAPKSK